MSDPIDRVQEAIGWLEMALQRKRGLSITARAEVKTALGYLRAHVTIDPIDAFNATHPPRVAPPPEPIRFAGGPAPADLSAFASARPIPFRGTYSPQTGHRRTWTRETPNPR